MSSLTQSGLNALNWTFSSAAIVLTAGRFGIRYTNRRCFYWDDGAQLLACLLMVGVSVAYTIIFPKQQQTVEIQAGTVAKPSAQELNNIFTTYLHVQLTISILFWSTLYAVKATFLLFFRLLFDVSPAFVKAWWAVVVFTFLTYWVCIGGELTACGTGSDLFKVQKCTSPSIVSYQTSLLIYSCVVNVASDVCIMALPLWMLRGLQMRLTQKLGLAAVFSLATVVIIFDIVRTVESTRGGAFSESATWSLLESTIAVIVASLPTYRTLLGVETRQRVGKYAHFVYKDNPIGRSLRPKISASSERVPGGHSSQTALTDANAPPPLPRAHLEDGYQEYALRDLNAGSTV